MKLYLDNCCFNRPYDDPTHIKIKLEIDAKLFIQEQIKNGNYKLVWSFILDFENEANPYFDIKESIKLWKNISTSYIPPKNTIKKRANELSDKFGLAPKDALHVACAIDAQCDYLITTDYKLIKKSVKILDIKIVNPITYISLMEVTDVK